MSRYSEPEIEVGDRVKWESQSHGSWKRKIGIVAEVNDTTLAVDVDTIASLDPRFNMQVFEQKILLKPERYFPWKRLCHKI